MLTVESHVETMCGAKVGLELSVSGACNDSFPSYRGTGERGILEMVIPNLIGALLHSMPDTFASCLMVCRVGMLLLKPPPTLT
jgi:hypothetical protein